MVPEQIDTCGWSEDDLEQTFSHPECYRASFPAWPARWHLDRDDEDIDPDVIADECDATANLDNYEVPDEVRQFAKHYDIARHLEKSIKLASIHFPNSAPTFHVDTDPSNPADVWIAIRVVVASSIAEALEREDRFSTDFLVSVPWPHREKIRLEYRFDNNDAAT